MGVVLKVLLCSVASFNGCEILKVTVYELCQDCYHSTSLSKLFHNRIGGSHCCVFLTVHVYECVLSAREMCAHEKTNASGWHVKHVHTKGQNAFGWRVKRVHPKGQTCLAFV